MPKRLSKIITLVTGLMVTGAAAQIDDSNTIAQVDRDGPVLVIYDSSNSMWGELADKSRKYESGRSALSALLDTDLGGREIGFRAYGHRHKTDCSDSELIVPFSDPQAAKRKSIKPPGTFARREKLRSPSA